LTGSSLALTAQRSRQLKIATGNEAIASLLGELAHYAWFPKYHTGGREGPEVTPKTIESRSFTVYKYRRLPSLHHASFRLLRFCFPSPWASSAMSSVRGCTLRRCDLNQVSLQCHRLLLLLLHRRRYPLHRRACPGGRRTSTVCLPRDFWR
jgi:hypothetical protein